jgi:hypothetical protein
VTDVNVNAGQDDEDDDLFTPATDTFPRRNDLRDRLVVIYPTGKHGTRKGDGPDAKPYPWYETTTVVLDDGPSGWQDTVPDDDGDPTPNLVPSVADNGPQVLTNFQWSATGLVSRIQTNLPGADGKPGSILGRINVMKNKVKGRSAPWSISKATEDDLMVARQYRAECKAARDAITQENVKTADADAF